MTVPGRKCRLGHVGVSRTRVNIPGRCGNSRGAAELEGNNSEASTVNEKAAGITVLHLGYITGYCSGGM